MKKLIYLFLIVTPTYLFSQTKLKFSDSLSNSKLGQTFTELGKCKTTESKILDFDNLSKITFFFFGFDGCIPCRTEFPLFLKLSNIINEINFVYITFNNEEYRNKEFESILGKNYVLNKNFYILQYTQEEIDKLNILTGYPTKCMFDKNNKIFYYGFGGKSLNSKSWIEYFSEILKTQKPLYNKI